MFMSGFGDFLILIQSLSLNPCTSTIKTVTQIFLLFSQKLRMVEKLEMYEIDIKWHDYLIKIKLSKITFLRSTEEAV